MSRATHSGGEHKPGSSGETELEKVDLDLRRSIDGRLGRSTPEPGEADGTAEGMETAGGGGFTEALMDSVRTKMRDQCLELFNRGLGQVVVSRQRVEGEEREVGRFGRWGVSTLDSGLGVIRLRIDAGKLVDRTALMERDIQLRARGDRPSSLAIVLRGDSEELVAQGPVPDGDGLIWTFALADLDGQGEYRPMLDCFLEESRVFQQADMARAAGVNSDPGRKRREEADGGTGEETGQAASAAGEEGPVRCIFPEPVEGLDELTVGFKWGPAAEGEERFGTFKEVFFAACGHAGVEYRNEKFVPIFGQIFITVERRDEEKVRALLQALNGELGKIS